MLAKEPDFVGPMLAPQLGAVTLPLVHFAIEKDLKPLLQKLGVRRVFETLDSLRPLAPRVGAVLTGVEQKTDLTVNERGIRADSFTITRGAIGKIVVGPPPRPFYMNLDRPFLFFIRDNQTKALLFEGAIMDPTAN
jgi:serpin B